MKVKWEPEADSGFKGSVMLDIPLYEDRINLLKGIGYESKVVDDKAESSLGSNDVDMAQKLAVAVKERASELDVIHLDSEKSFRTLDELGITRQGGRLINAMGSILLNGVDLGKKQKGKSKTK